MTMTIRRTLLLAVLAVGIALPVAAVAQTSPIIPPCATQSGEFAGSCTTDDFIGLFVNLANWGLVGLSGLSIFFVMWGGFTLATSAGSSEKVTEGKSTIMGAITGVIIVLASYALVNTIVLTFTNADPSQFNAPAKIFGRPWAGESPTCRTDNESANCSSTPLNLHQGCNDGIDDKFGRRVQDLQLRLFTLGCIDARQDDGCFGPITEDAVVRFQEINGLDADGTINDNDQAVLDGNPQRCLVSASESTGQGCCVPGWPGYPCIPNATQEQCNTIIGGYIDGDTNCENFADRCTLGCCANSGSGSCQTPASEPWCEMLGSDWEWDEDVSCLGFSTPIICLHTDPPPGPPNLPL